MSDINELAKALNEFQSEVVRVGKSADNPFFRSKYAPLDAIMQAALPTLTKHGLSVMQLPDNIDGSPALTTIVMHTSGQSQSATTPLILTKADPQGQGSAITYMRRYAYAAALGIVVDEDDDGNKASGPTTRTAAPKTAPRPAVGTDNLASPLQKRRIKALLTGKGVADADMPSYLENEFGIVPGTNLTAEDAENILLELA